MLNARLIRLEKEMRKRKPRKTVYVYVTDWSGNPIPVPEIKGNPRNMDIVRIRHVKNWRENRHHHEVIEANSPDPDYNP